MAIELSESDYLPQWACEFQHWGERTGEPYEHLRPLKGDAAEKVWRRTVAMAAATWTTGSGSAELDLRTGDWDGPSVRDWLLSRVPDRDQLLIVCYQPHIVLCVPWGVLCDHWLLLLWTGGCAYPASEDWVLVHDGDRFALGFKPAGP